MLGSPKSVKNRVNLWRDYGGLPSWSTTKSFAPDDKNNLSKRKGTIIKKAFYNREL